MDAALAIDVRRATCLERAGYRVWTQTIPAAITAKNRLLLGQLDHTVSRLRSQDSGKITDVSRKPKP